MPRYRIKTRTGYSAFTNSKGEAMNWLGSVKRTHDPLATLVTGVKRTKRKR